MANTKSQKKRIITNAKSAERNKAVRAEVKTRIKAARAAVGTDGETEALRLAIKRIDKAAQKGVMHKNAAAFASSDVSAAVVRRFCCFRLSAAYSGVR
jgi:small subunit ribosomal protein S20